MDLEKQKRRQSLRVLISEGCMVVAVIITVLVLAFVVSGYWVNSDFEVERQGLLQVSSTPTGANIEIDGGGSSWFQRTNTSKMLSSGEHTVTLTKENYDSWTKTVTISEGLLYRIHYPYLFLKNREIEKVLDVPAITLATISPDKKTLLLINDTTSWSLINLDSDRLELKPLDIFEYFSSVSRAEGASVGLFTGEVLSFDWASDNSHLLLKTNSGIGIEWVILDVKNPKNSVNLTKTFGPTLSEVKILDNSANVLLAISNGNLHRIDVSGRSISAILVENVDAFDHYDNEIILSAKNNEGKNYLGLFRLGSDKIKEIKTLDSSVRPLISKFYEDKYITILDDKKVTIHKKDSEEEELLLAELSFTPEQARVGHEGEFITFSSGSSIATLDMESLKILEWNADGESYGWLNNDMIYSVKNGELVVYDYDGQNRRILSGNVSERFPIMITSDKWLYYFSDGELIREWLIPR